MQLGMVGLGRMGGNMTRRLARAGIAVVACDRLVVAREALQSEPGVRIAPGIVELAAALAAPRIVWCMLPAGEPTEQALAELVPQLAPGDLVVDGANAHYRDSQRRARTLGARGLAFIDAGVSGGVWGLEQGYGLMLGGEAADIERLRPVLERLAPAPDRGWLHCGAAGAGHFTKMVHNGIEYGLMQAYAEGLALLEARADLGLDVARIAEAWRHGTVIRSWLLDLTADFLAAGPGLEGIEPYVADSGEGRWTALEAIELGVPAPVMSLALMTRFASQGRADYAAKLLAKMRQAFGGHAVRDSADTPTHR